jgi:N-acetylglutamate synthase-like GNAT family acetyltransferase
MKIKELEERDFAGLSELVLQVYDEMPYAMTFEHRPSQQELAELMQKKIQGMRDRTLVDLVAVEGERVVADCEIVKSTESGGTVGIIVAKDHRRRGIGKRLIERSSEKAKELKMLEVYAEIDERNESAGSFFANCGFKEQVEGRELIMVKSL